MKNLDLNKSRQEVVDDLYKAMAGEDKDQLNNAMTAFADNIRQEVLKEARQDASGQADRTILANEYIRLVVYPGDCFPAYRDIFDLVVVSKSYFQQ